MDVNKVINGVGELGAAESGQASGGVREEVAAEEEQEDDGKLKPSPEPTDQLSQSAIAMYFGALGPKPRTEPNDRGTEASVTINCIDRSVIVFWEPIILNHRSTEPFGSVEPNAHP